MTTKTASISEFKERLTKRAEQDPEFRSLLLKDTNKAIELEFGVKLPAATQVIISIDRPFDGPQELDDDALDNVSGGLNISVVGISLPPRK